MYFWRVERLKDQLREGPLSQQASFAYVLASGLLCAVGTYAPAALWNATTTPDPTTTAEWLTYAMMIIVVGIGTYVAYLANGGRGGFDFAPRYFALGWVLLIRLVVLVLLPAVVLMFVASVVLQRTTTPRQLEDWGAAVVGLLFEIVYYWRMVLHLRQVALADVERARAQ